MGEGSPETFTVRVLGPDGRAAGLGALVGDRQVITCAHVVNAAFRLDQRSQGRPGGTVRLDFPLLAQDSASSESLTGTVSAWRPPPPATGATGDDIAGLVISGDLPDGARPGHLAADPPQPGTPVRVFGYSPQRPDGGLVAATIRGQVANGRLQLDAAIDSALRMQPGFSGSPVFDDGIGRIVGLVSQAGDAKGPTNDSLAISPALLRDAWPEAFGADLSRGSPRTRGELSILHISGPRFRAADDGATDDDDALLTVLRGDLAELADQHGLRPEMLVVTGDLADGGLPTEYQRAFEFVARLAGAAGIPRRHVAIVPGSHDVNRGACHGYFLTQAAEQQAPVPPYFPKWKAYAAAFQDFYRDVPGVTFTPDEPWSLFEMHDLGLVVAGLNSTMPESHEHTPERRPAELTSLQLDWFAQRLAILGRVGWRRIAAISNHVTADAAALDEILGATGVISLLLSGNPDGPRKLPSGVYVLPTASLTPTADAPAKYEIITVRPGDITRHGRVRTSTGWASDDTITVHSHRATGPTETKWPRGSITLDATTGRDAFVAGRDIYVNQDREPGPDQGRDTFLTRVAEATRLRFPNATVTERTQDSSRYLRVSESPESGTAEVRPVGVMDGPMTEEALNTFIDNVHRIFAAADPGVRSELVYSGAVASPVLLHKARSQGVRLRSFIEYQGLLDLRPYTERQARTLAADSFYPAALYVEQRFTVASGGYAQALPEVRAGLLDQATDWLSSDAARLVVVLGDFGRGKTSFLRQLTRLLPAQLPYLAPVLVELRYLEKGPTLDDLLAQHLIRHGVEDFSQAKLKYMIEQGRVALLFDGFDELELRVGYDSAADYLQSLLNSLTGRAKVVLTSRTQHFRSTSQVHAAVRTALGDRVESRTGSRVAILEDFTEDQIREFLTNLYNGDASRAQRRFGLIRHIAGLLDLTRNPRMLAFVAQLTDERLLAVQSGRRELTAGDLYEEIIDYWLASEQERQSHARGLAALTKDERFQVCTNLALRMWRTFQPSISLRDLRAEVVATLRELAERGFTDDQAAHSIASGSLLVRTEDESFQFVHQSVMEWLVAAHAAREFRSARAAPVLEARQMSRLMAAFFTDVAGQANASEWALSVFASSAAPDTARHNALAVRDRLPQAPTPERHDLSGLDLRGRDLNGWDLRGASLRGANLRGMRLSDVNLEGADLTGADFTGAVLTRGSLRGASLAGSHWAYAALLGTGSDGPSGQLAAAAIPGQHRAEVVIDQSQGNTRCVAYSPDGMLLAFGKGSVAKIADAVTGRTLRALRGHGGILHGVAFSPDGTRIATASDDGTARTWDTATGQLITTLTGHSAPVTSIAWAPDGTRIATASDDGTARTWDVVTGRERVRLGHAKRMIAIAFSPDGAIIAAVFEIIDYNAELGDGRVSQAGIYDAASGDCRAMLTSCRSAMAVRFSPDGALLEIASADGTAHTWDVATARERFRLVGYFGSVIAIAFSPDGTRIATTSWDNITRTWDTATGQQLTTLTGHGEIVTSVAWSPDGTRIATASRDDTARTWDTATGQQLTTLTGHGEIVTSVAWSPDGTRIATASSDRTARTWDTATGQQITTLTGHDETVSAVAWSPDATRIATASSDRTARTWDPTNGRQVVNFTGHSEPVRAVAWSPDGTCIATASDDGTARTWDRKNGRLLTALTGHGKSVRAVAWSPDGTRIATASSDRTARTWDATTGQHLATLTGHAGTVRAVAWSPDGTRIATASHDGTGRVWTVAELSDTPLTLLDRLRRRIVPAATASITLKGHQGPVTVVAFHPHQERLFTASTDGTVRIWRLPGGPAEHVLTGHDGTVRGIAFRPGGREFVTASDDGTVRIWSMETLKTIATLVPLPEGGCATLLPDGTYKLQGDPGDRLWWAMRLCRFGPGELDPYVPHIQRLPDDAPILLPRH